MKKQFTPAERAVLAFVIIVAIVALFGCETTQPKQETPPVRFSSQ